MSNNPEPTQECARCGKCCLAPVIMIIKPSDYRRWVKQGRTDILEYVSMPPEGDYGDFLPDLKNPELSEYCPFIKKEGEAAYTCKIQDTKPDVCRKFYCEWCYSEGKTGVPFKTEQGWTDKAKKSGYSQLSPRKSAG